MRERRCGWRTGRALVLVGGVACTMCVKAPTEPSPAPPLEGAYVLLIEASSVCSLRLERYQWGVEARTVGSGAGAEARVTLPPGNDAIDLNLTYALNPSSSEDLPPANLVRGSLTSRRAASGPSHKVTIGGEAQGVVTDAGGRGEITSGTFNGTISLTDKAEAEDPGNDSLGSCTAADHLWSLLAG